MILSVTLSKPSKNVQEILGKEYEKIKIKIKNSADGISYYAEMFTKTQAFHKHFSENELEDFLLQNEGKSFKNCIKITETEEITSLANKKGEIRVFTKPIRNKVQTDVTSSQNTANLKYFATPQRQKKYILEEGKPVPFLVLLGIMNTDGKVISSKYDKFRQINRFLEFIKDITPELLKSKKSENDGGRNPVRIVDFGCGKSYLTFAIHYYFTEIKQIPCSIEGLDLKEDVISYCNEIVHKLNLKNIIFRTGNIENYSEEENPDLIITLHACDTATDYALKYAVEKNAKAILSVPCCQHQINQQLDKNKSLLQENVMEPLLKWGIIKERFSALVTDALRGEWLEKQGYNVQMLEFIDMEHTPKNLMIRAVKKSASKPATKPQNTQETKKAIPKLINELGIAPEIFK